MSDAFIIDAARTPRAIGKVGKGGLAHLHPQHVAATVLKAKPPGASVSGVDALRAVLRDGPGLGVHVFGWWRGLRRLTDDLGLNHKDDVAGIVALNVRGSELGSFLGQINLKWSPRPNRALFVDRQQDTKTLIVPYVVNGRYDTLDGES